MLCTVCLTRVANRQWLGACWHRSVRAHIQCVFQSSHQWYACAASGWLLCAPYAASAWPSDCAQHSSSESPVGSNRSARFVWRPDRPQSLRGDTANRSAHQALLPPLPLWCALRLCDALLHRALLAAEGQDRLYIVSESAAQCRSIFLHRQLLGCLPKR